MRFFVIFLLLCGMCPPLFASEEKHSAESSEKKEEKPEIKLSDDEVIKCVANEDCTYIEGKCPGDYFPVNKNASKAQRAKIQKEGVEKSPDCLNAEYVSLPIVHCMQEYCGIVPIARSRN